MAWNWKFWQKGAIAADEAWVLACLHKITSGVKVIESDIVKTVNWVFAHSAEIEADLTTIIQVATGLGLVNPAVTRAITGATALLHAINDYQAKVAAGASPIAAAEGAYQSSKSLQIVVAEAKQVIAAGTGKKAG